MLGCLPWGVLLLMLDGYEHGLSNEPLQGKLCQTGSHELDRRHFIAATALAGNSYLLSPPLRSIGREVFPGEDPVLDFPIRGIIAPGMEVFEEVLLNSIEDGIVPAAQLCVSKDGEIVFNRAYGFANSQQQIPLETHARFGIASLDKVVTETAIELLCKQEVMVKDTGFKMSKELKPFLAYQRLGIVPSDSQIEDRRILDISVEQLLRHNAGHLDERVHEGFAVQRLLNLDRLPTPSDGIRFLCKHPLLRAPGTKAEYNSAGYFVLRTLIELCGGGFLRFLREEVFRPAGTQDICLCRARPEDRDPLEVRYLCSRKGPSIFPQDRGLEIPEVEGGFGRYVDNHLVLGCSAEALTRYLTHWVFGKGERLWTTQSSKLGDGVNNGGGSYNGGMVGIATTMEQRRWSMCNYTALANWVDTKPGVAKRVDFPGELYRRIQVTLKSLGW